jgi:methionine sulfoxide reductase heme-binding subunit
VTTTASPLWYATRATGVMTLILLTATVVLGVATSAGAATPRMPRVVTSALHRNVSLLVLVFVAAHVLTTVLDGYTSIGLTAALVPFSSSYRGFWLGLGAVAFDLLLAVTGTSLLRHRMSYRSWRAVHWLTYASWPVALWHGLGTGTDSRVSWLLILDVLCAGSVLGAAGWRLAHTRPGVPRIVLSAAAVLLPLATAVFVAFGPLQPGWARRAGTPVSLLGRHQSATSQAASFSGAARQASGPATGQVTITVTGRTSGPAARALTVVLHGTPDDSGIEMSSGTVQLGAIGPDPARQGPVTQLEGHQLTATVRDAAGRPEQARLYLVIHWPRASGQLALSSGAGS